MSSAIAKSAANSEAVSALKELAETSKEGAELIDEFDIQARRVHGILESCQANDKKIRSTIDAVSSDESFCCYQHANSE